MASSKQCTRCKKVRELGQFYLAANNVINSDGNLPICKHCLTQVTSDYYDIKNFIHVMRMIDRPFLRDEYEVSKTYNNPLGEYMRRLGMKQNRNATYLDSNFDEELLEFVAGTEDDLEKKNKVEDHVSFKIDKEARIRWGDGYSDKQLYKLETFYTEMKQSNEINTPQHIEQLKLLCKINLKQDESLTNNNFNDFKNLNMQYNKILADSGFRPIDRVSGSESIGIRTFSQVWEEIERDGFIEPYPWQESQEIVDRTIMYTGNYTRSLTGQPSMSEPPADTPKVDGEYNE